MPQKSYFWYAQIGGWLLVGITNYFAQLSMGMDAELVLKNSLTVVFAGLLVTTVYRYALRWVNWESWGIWQTLGTILISSLGLTICWIFICSLLSNVSVGRGLSMGELIGNTITGYLFFLPWNLIYFAYHFLRRWHYAEIRRYQLEADRSQAQLEALKAQLNPHFIFNGLNDIRALVREDPEKARDMLTRLSDLLRYSLNSNKISFISLRQELDMVHNYLALCYIQYEERLTVEGKFEPQSMDQSLPPMLLQLLVENGIKHGIAQYEEGGVLTISTQKEGASLILEVRNPGQLTEKPAKDATAIGLYNLQKRLELLYDGNASFELKQDGAEVVAVVRLPVEASTHQVA